METFPLPKVVPVGGQAKASGGTQNPGPSEAPGVAWSLPLHSQALVLRAGQGRLGCVFLQDGLGELLSDKDLDHCSRGGIVVRCFICNQCFKTMDLVYQEL